MSESEPLVRLVDVSKRYRGAPETGEVEVLKGLSLTIAAGESVSIAGPSGSGKSTLLNLLGALDQPTSGSVVIDGQDLNDLDPEQLAEFRNRLVGFIFQAHYLLPQCTVMENVLVPTLATRDPSVHVRARERAPTLLERVGLSHRLAHFPAQLSGGECQRVAVVRALINQPKLLLADEPTGALDRASAENLRDLLLGLNREEGVTLVVVTHALSLAERMKRRFELRDGLLAAVANGG